MDRRTRMAWASVVCWIAAAAALSGLVAVAAGDSTTQPREERVLALDLGTGPVQDGWQAVAPDAADTAAVHWAAPITAPDGYRDRGGDNPLLRDGVSARDVALVIPLAPGQYRVVVHVGDATYGHDRQEVSLNGAVIGTATTQRGRWAAVEGAVEVETGPLTVRVRDAGGTDPNVFVCGVEVLQTAGSDDEPPVSIEPPVTTQPAEPGGAGAPCNAFGLLRLGAVQVRARCGREPGHEGPHRVQVQDGDDVLELEWAEADAPPAASTRPVVIVVEP